MERVLEEKCTRRSSRARKPGKVCWEDDPGGIRKDPRKGATNIGTFSRQKARGRPLDSRVKKRSRKWGKNRNISTTTKRFQVYTWTKS